MNDPHDYATIDLAELQRRLLNKEVILLDAQAPGRFDKEHIPGAHPVDWFNIEPSVQALTDDPTAPIVVYCQNTACTGSGAIAEHLTERGWTNVIRYPGGKEAWAAAGLPLDTVATMAPDTTASGNRP